MKKTQAVKFWKAVNESTSIAHVISEFEFKEGYGGRHTLVRYKYAQDGFRKGQSTEPISIKTGLSRKYIDKLREWWEEEFRRPQESHNSGASSLQSDDTKQTEDIVTIISKLKILDISGTQVDAIKILYRLRENLAIGLPEYDVPVSSRPILVQLCILQIVEVKQRRRSSGPHPYDESNWVITGLGKRIIQYLEREK